MTHKDMFKKVIDMKTRGKIRIATAFCSALLILIMAASFAYAAVYEVNKEEFLKEWKKAYRELKATDPEVANEFYVSTKKELKAGSIRFSGSDKKLIQSSRKPE